MKGIIFFILAMIGIQIPYLISANLEQTQILNAMSIMALSVAFIFRMDGE